MTSNRKEDWFSETKDWDREWAKADSDAELESELEPDFQPEPDPEPWEEPEPNYEEEPTDEPLPPRHSPYEPLGLRQKADSGVGPVRQKADSDVGPVRQQRANAPFIKGPLCREWFVRAMALRKPAVMVGLGLWFKAGVERDDFLRAKRAESKPIRIARGFKKQFRLSDSQLSRGLHALKKAGLVLIVRGGAGRCPVVVIINIQIPRFPVRQHRK